MIEFQLKRICGLVPLQDGVADTVSVAQVGAVELTVFEVTLPDETIATT